MNEMLERVEDATVRQQRFVADASHELRSPLTRIRTELEVDLARPETADLRTTGESVLEETVAMEALIGDLLHLARSDAGASAGRRQPVDLDDLVMREAASIRARGRVTVDMHGVSAAQVVGDPDHLARAVRNLVDNAQRHATSAITLALVEHGGVARLVVADDGPGIPTGQRGLIFERFARLDDARSRDAGGTGLGLAITREIIEAHGGTIVVGDADAGGAEFVVEIPLSRP
jgi:signal transduction histidine kinase